MTRHKEVGRLLLPIGVGVLGQIAQLIASAYGEDVVMSVRDAGEEKQLMFLLPAEVVAPASDPWAMCVCGPNPPSDPRAHRLACPVYQLLGPPVTVIRRPSKPDPDLLSKCTCGISPPPMDVGEHLLTCPVFKELG